MTEPEKAPAPGQAVYGWPSASMTIYCGDCGYCMRQRYKEDGSRFSVPMFDCTNETCPRHGKLYELSTAHAVILHEVAQPAAPEAKHE